MKSSGTDGPPNTVLNVTPRVIDLPPLRIIPFQDRGPYPLYPPRQVLGHIDRHTAPVRLAEIGLTFPLIRNRGAVTRCSRHLRLGELDSGPGEGTPHKTRGRRESCGRRKYTPTNEVSANCTPVRSVSSNAHRSNTVLGTERSPRALAPVKSQSTTLGPSATRESVAPRKLHRSNRRLKRGCPVSATKSKRQSNNSDSKTEIGPRAKLRSIRSNVRYRMSNPALPAVRPRTSISPSSVSAHGETRVWGGLTIRD